MPNVNPKVLLWARETAGLSLEEAVRKLQLKEARGVNAVDRLAALESGSVQPTRSMLAKMAKHYRRPLVTFYLEALPEPGQRGTDFRTLPTDRTPDQDAFVQALVREVVAKQGLVRAQLEDDEADEVGFVGSRAMSDGRGAIQRALNSLAHSSDSAPSGADWQDFRALREAVESKGVFVLLQGDLGSYHSDIDANAFRGFALADRLAPFIVINDNDARTAWSFTLLHEMVHLLLGETGISDNQANSEVEQFCNDVASECLMPQSAIDAFPVEGLTFDHLAESIGRLAREWKVSRALVAYRLHRSGAIDTPLYRRLATTFRQQWNEQRQRREQGGDGGDFYRTKRHRTGTALLEFVRRNLGPGGLPTTKAAIVLGVKPTQVGPMLGMMAEA